MTVPVLHRPRCRKILCKALIQCLDKVPYSDSWQEIYQEHGVGQPFGDILLLTAQDRQRYQALLFQLFRQTPQQLLDLPVDLNRIEASQIYPDEKIFATLAPSHTIVHVKATDAVLNIAQGYRIPLGGYLGMTVNEALQHRYQQVVVIENAEVFQQSERIVWPDVIGQQPALLIFRGSSQATPRASHEFIRQQICPVYAFFDFDPKGLEMAITLPRCDGIILPDFTRTTVNVLRSLSVKEKFNKQFPAQQYLQNRSEFAQVSRLLLGERLAIQQEALLSAQLPLQLIRAYLPES